MSSSTEAESCADLGVPPIPKFRAGDTVYHTPSGEEWILAYDEENGRVSACGWPESMVNAEECALRKSATDEERLTMLNTWANQEGSDHRTRAAKRQLATETPASKATKFEPCPFCGATESDQEMDPDTGTDIPCLALHNWKGIATVQCCRCGSAGPLADPEKAVAAWNQRDPKAKKP